ncbi:MAG: hypothetical protein ACJ75N_10125 [Actinomycetes bacterium]
MSRAITAQEVSTRTSMPATLPTRQDDPNIAASSPQVSSWRAAPGPLDHEAAFVVVGQAPVRYWFDDAIS